jgi:fatty-acyl-CoA synthase
VSRSADERIATLADVRRIETVPLAERALPACTFDVIDQAAQRHGSTPALAFFVAAEGLARPRRWRYAELRAEVVQCANALHALGVRPGQAVSLLLPNLPQTHFLLWGTQCLGVVNPVNPLLEPAQIAAIVDAAESEVLVTVGPFPRSELWAKACEVARRVPRLRRLATVDPGRFLPWVQRQAATLVALRLRRQQPPPQGVDVVDLDRLCAQQPSRERVFAYRPTAQDAAAYFHTGGTTGTPKLAVHTHANQVYNGWAMARWVDLSPGEAVIAGLPLFHVNAVVATGVAAFHAGAQIVLAGIAGYRTPGLIDRLWDIVAHYRAVSISGVPTLYSTWLQKPFHADKAKTLRYAACGAAPLPPEVFREFERRTGLELLEGYGLTEGTCASAVNPPDGPRRLGSVGLPLPYQRLRCVVLDEAGRCLRDARGDEVGHLVMRGPQVFAGYRQTLHNDRLWLDIDREPWLLTGDLARIDAQGYVWLAGRQKELIIRGGHNIDPSAIEGPLQAHPAVALAAAVGRPDAHAGEVPVAYVTLKPGATASEPELLAFARERIPERAAQPKAVTIVDQLPLTAVGKVFKPALRDLEIRTAFTEALQGSIESDKLSIRMHDTTDRGRVATVTIAVTTPDEQAQRLKQAAESAVGAFAIAADVVLRVAATGQDRNPAR